MENVCRAVEKLVVKITIFFFGTLALLVTRRDEENHPTVESTA